MSAFTFNVSLGREVELYNRVNSDDPTNSALIMVILALAGLETDAVLKDKDTLADVVSGTTNEVTNTGYSRKVLTDADLAAYTVDDSADTITLYLPLQTFSGIATGDTWAKGVIGYDPDTTGGTDAAIIPVIGFDVRIDGSPVVPNGDDIVVDFSTNGLVVCR
jgi:hypothetical protein